MRKTIPIGHLKVKLTIVWTEKDEPIKHALKRHGLPYSDIPPDIEGICFDAPAGKNKDWMRVVVGLGYPARRRPDIIAHEAVHAAVLILSFYNIPSWTVPGRDENFAYWVQSVTSAIWRSRKLLRESRM